MDVVQSWFFKRGLANGLKKRDKRKGYRDYLFNDQKACSLLEGYAKYKELIGQEQF